MIKVSVCIPTYNNVSGLKRLLDSLAVQTFHDYEIIISDNSDDQSIYHLIQNYSLPIQYMPLPKGNPTANWNNALSMAHGEYIKIMHHDDWFTDNDSLMKSVMLLDHAPEALLAFCGSRQVNLSDSSYYDRFISDSDVTLIRSDWHNLFLDNTIGAPSAVIYRNSANAFRFDESLKWLVDMDYYMQILSQNSTFVYTIEPLTSIGLSSKQITASCISDASLIMTEYMHLYKKYSLNHYSMSKVTSSLLASPRTSELPLSDSVSVYKRKMLCIIYQYGSLKNCMEASISPVSYYLGKLMYRIKR